MRSFGTELSANRRPSGQTSPELRAAIIASLAAGESPTNVAARFKVARSTVYSVKDRWINDQALTPRPRTGRPTVHTPQDHRAIKFHVRRDPTKTRKALVADLGLDCSPTTIKRSLQANNLRKWVAKKEN